MNLESGSVLSNDDMTPPQGEQPIELPKPRELRRVGPAAEGLFNMLRRWFDVGPVLTADISIIQSDNIETELQDPQMVARFTMRRLQALYWISQPTIRTTTDVVLIQIDSILRALLESPSRHLRRAHEDVDWDHDWAVLDAGMFLASQCPKDEADQFEKHVQTLFSAREAVAGHSGGQILILR